MEDLITLRIFSTFRLLLAVYLLFFWVPRKILPQEYIEDSMDRVMFNIIHMTAIIILLIPLFVYLRFFGLPFLVVFFFLIKLAFLKFWYKKSLAHYLRDEIYHGSIIFVLETMEDYRAYIASLKNRMRNCYVRLKSSITPFGVFKIASIVTITGYALYIRLLGPFSSMVASASDMYQYFYWNKILKLNKLFDKIAGAPYPWGGPVFAYTVNLLAELNTVILFNTFPLLVLSFAFFSVYYFLKKLIDHDNVGTAAPLIAIVLFGIVIPSPYAQNFFGTIFSSASPQMYRLPLLSIYTGPPGARDAISVLYPFIFFNRFTNFLPYEMATVFSLPFLYFLHKALITRRTVFILLFAETLAIMSTTHPGVLLPLFFPALLITINAVILHGIDRDTLRRGTLAVGAALILGNTWLMQFLIYGIPQNIGAAAPILDKIFKTNRAAMYAAAEMGRSPDILYPSLLLIILLLLSLALFILAFLRNKEDRASHTVIPLISFGILFVYGVTNLGLPRIVDHSRLQAFVALTYSLVSAELYNLIIEKSILRRFFEKRAYAISIGVVLCLALTAISITPRWIDSEKYWKTAMDMELSETPYFVYKIENTFQPLSYTVVSYVEGFSQIYSHGYHINTHDLISTYSPIDRSLKIPTEFVFIFVENTPVPYQGSGEFWYRWRQDIMLKLKDWIALYGRNHNNLRLWRETANLQVYLIDNREAQNVSADKWRQLTGTSR